MDCDSHEDIINTIESIFSTSEHINLKEYWKYISTKKYLKNIIPHRHYDSKIKSYKLLEIAEENWTDDDILSWISGCTELPEYECMNEI